MVFDSVALGLFLLLIFVLVLALKIQRMEERVFQLIRFNQRSEMTEDDSAEEIEEIPKATPSEFEMAKAHNVLQTFQL